MSNLCDLDELTSFLVRHQDDATNRTMLYNIKRFVAIRDAKFSPKEITKWTLDAWKPVGKTKQTGYQKTLPTEVTLVNIDQDYPFVIVLRLNTTTGKPSIDVDVLSVFSWSEGYAGRVAFQKEVMLKTRKRGLSERDQLLYYWNNQSILKALTPDLKEKPMVAFKTAMALLKTKPLLDCNDKKLSVTASKCIAYMYAQIKNKTGMLLDGEPIAWAMPNSVIARISTGLADSLQDNLYYVNTQSNQTEYNGYVHSEVGN